MKADWEEKELGQFSKIMYGYTTSSSENKIGPKFLRITDIQNNSVNWSDVPYCQISDSDYTKYKLKIGDIVFARTGGTTGKSFLIENDIDSVFASYLIRVQADKNIIYSDYLYYYFQSSSYWKSIELGISGSAQGGFNAKKLSSLKIPLPPLSEQKKIADRLDKVSELMVLRKKQAELLDTAVKARFTEMFGDPVTNPMGWDSKSFTDVCVSIYGGGTPSKNHPEYFKGNIPWVSPKDMKSIIIIDSIDHINETAIKNSSTKIVPKNSILMVIRSGILKHSLPVGINIVPVTINQDMKAFIPNKKIKSTYLLYYFKAIEKDVLTKVRGVTADNIDFKDFLNRKIPLPPLALQNEFAEFVTAVEKTKVPVIKSIEALETLKKSLMQEYFG